MREDRTSGRSAVADSALAALAALALWGLAACGSSTDGGDGQPSTPRRAHVPAACPDSVKPPADQPYAIYSPRPGDIYHVGDSLDINVCSNDPEFQLSDADIVISFGMDSTGTKRSWHSLKVISRDTLLPYSAYDTAAYSDDFSSNVWVIGDSLHVGKKAYPTASNQVLVKITAYNQATITYTQLPGPFTILPR